MPADGAKILGFYSHPIKPYIFGMQNWRTIIVICWIGLIPATLSALPTDSLRTAMDYWNSFLTEEERLFYSSDYFPFSLGQKGRFAVGSWRGLPPGSRELWFQHTLLENPAYAAWNTQLTPRFRTWNIVPTAALPEIRYRVLPVPRKARTIITHFLDFIMNLSLVDIDFQRQYGKGNRLWLGGHNFLREGSEPNGSSSIQTTAYFGQITHQLSRRWAFRGWYYQAHNDFNLPPETIFSFTPAQLKERAILVGGELQGHLLRQDTTAVQLFTHYFTDVYRENRQTRRRYQVTRPGIAIRTTFPWRLGVWQIHNQLALIRASGYPFRVLEELENRARVSVQEKSGTFRWRAQVGAWYHSAFGWRPEGGFRFTIHSPRWEVTARAFQRHQAQPTPQRAGTDTIPAFRPAGPGTITGVNFSFSVQPIAPLSLGLTAFSGTYNHTARLDTSGRWHAARITNRGVRGDVQLTFSHLWLNGSATYNKDWEQAFAPRWHGVFQAGIRFQLFNGALKARGIFTLNYFDRYRMLRFNRFWRTFQQTELIQPGFPVADFRLLVAIRTLTLYFIWENMLSTDYALVEGTLEYLRLFRLGVRWTLWN